MRTKLHIAAASLMLILPLEAVGQEPPREERRTRIVLSDPAGTRLLEGPEAAAWFMSGRRTFLGVQLTNLTPELRTHMGAPSNAGMLVGSVSEDSPASRAGIRVGDVITQIGNKRIENIASVSESLRDTKDGERISVSVVRNHAPLQLNAQIEERDRRALALNRLPEGVRWVGPEGSDSVHRDLREFFASPEWASRVTKLEDCRDSQQKLRELETRLKELEKRIR